MNGILPVLLQKHKCTCLYLLSSWETRFGLWVCMQNFLRRHFMEEVARCNALFFMHCCLNFFTFCSLFMSQLNSDWSRKRLPCSGFEQWVTSASPSNRKSCSISLQECLTCHVSFPSFPKRCSLHFHSCIYTRQKNYRGNDMVPMNFQWPDF